MGLICFFASICLSTFLFSYKPDFIFKLDFIFTVKEKPKKDERITRYHPKNLAEIEEQLCEAAVAAIEGYQESIGLIRDYNQQVEKIIDHSFSRIDQTIWTDLKNKSELKDKQLKEAEKHADIAAKKLKTLEDLVKDESFEGSPEARATIKRAMDRYNEDIKLAKKQLQVEKEGANITDRYWYKVKEARNHFIEDLEVLFPGIDISKQKLTLSSCDLDLFLLHAFSHVLYYQKELFKLETVENFKMKVAMEKLASDPEFDVVQEHIREAIEKEKRALELDYQKKVKLFVKNLVLRFHTPLFAG